MNQFQQLSAKIQSAKAELQEVAKREGKVSVAQVFGACNYPPESKTEATTAPDGKPALTLRCACTPWRCPRVLIEACPKGYTILANFCGGTACQPVFRCAP